MAVIDRHNPKLADGTVVKLAPGDRPKGQRWEVDYRDGAGKRYRKRFSTKTDAHDFEREQRSLSSRGDGVDPSAARRLTVADLWTAYVKRLNTQGGRGRDGIAEKTLYRYTRQYDNHIRPRWEHTRLASVRHTDVEEWLSGLQEVQRTDGASRPLPRQPAGRSTRNDVGTLFKRMLDEAVRLDFLHRNPATDRLGNSTYIPPAGNRTGSPHASLTMPQLATLADAGGAAGRLVIWTAGLCGLRWGELSALRVSDLRNTAHGWELSVTKAYTEVQGRLVEKSTKTGEDRTVPVPATLAVALSDLAGSRQADGLLFQSTKGAALRNGNFTKRIYEPARRALAEQHPDAGRPTFHDLRHTAVTLAISAGANIMVVQRIAGHARASTTLDIYAQAFSSDLHDSAQRLDALIPVGFGGQFLDS